MADLVHVSTHPLVFDKVTRLRDRTTPPKEFREVVADLARLLFLEASADLRLQSISVHTPLAPCPGHRLAERIGLFLAVLEMIRCGQIEMQQDDRFGEILLSLHTAP